MPAANWKDLMNKAEEGAKEFALLEEGPYAFVIKEAAKVGETGKGNPKFTINPSVESGPRANARVFHDFIVSDSPFAMKNFFFGDLAILGLGIEFFNQNPTDQQIAQALQGRRFVAEVFHEPGHSDPTKKFAKLRNFAAPTSAPPGAGVPGGLPSTAPVATGPSIPQAVAPAPVVASAPAPASPWDNAPTAVPAPAANNNIMLPPSFG
jgi:hypothetical protein